MNRMWFYHGNLGFGLKVMFLLGALSVSPVNPVLAQDDDKKVINWFTQTWQPFNIPRGKDKYTGLNDELIQFIHKHLTEYEINWVNTDLSRFVQSMKDKNDICKVDFFKTKEREVYSLFSEVPSGIDLNLRVFVMEKKARQLNLKNPLNLPQLLANPDLESNIPLERNYGEAIEAMLAEAEGNGVKLRKDIPIQRILKNFFNGRLDYVIEYSPVITYYAQTSENKGNIYSFAIEGTSPYVISYVACADTDFGREIMPQINKVLQEQRYSKDYLEILEKWHSQANKEELRRYYSHF